MVYSGFFMLYAEATSLNDGASVKQGPETLTRADHRGKAVSWQWLWSHSSSDGSVPAWLLHPGKCYTDEAYKSLLLMFKWD